MRTAVTFFLVEHEHGDWLGWALAWLCFVPPFLVAMQTACWLTLLLSSIMLGASASRASLQHAERLARLLLMGQVGNELLNHLLKRLIRQPRPDSTAACRCRVVIPGVDDHSYADFGMPSSHAQFMGFSTAVLPPLASLVLHGLLPRATALCAAWAFRGACVAGTGLVALARVYLGYHTREQVLAGLVVGYVVGEHWLRSSAAGVLRK